jgi:hypothetical protein
MYMPAKRSGSRNSGRWKITLQKYVLMIFKLEDVPGTGYWGFKIESTTPKLVMPNMRSGYKGL